MVCNIRAAIKDTLGLAVTGKDGISLCAKSEGSNPKALALGTDNRRAETLEISQTNLHLSDSPLMCILPLYTTCFARCLERYRAR